MKIRLWKSKTIFGCDARGDGDQPYLTRHSLLKTKWFQVCVHVFHRSDADELHDHPFGFISLILWRGYIEETPTERRRLWPGMIVFRRATWIHRVEVINDKPAVTLVLLGPRRRDWGFWTRSGWKDWRAYFREKGCKP